MRRQREARPTERRQHDQDRIFGDPVEQIGSEEAGRDAADRAAGRHPYVEDGEVARCRPSACELAMADERVDEEDRAMDANDPDDGLDRIEDHHRDKHEDKERLQSGGEPVRDERPALKHDDESQKIERKRDYPEEGHRRHIGRDVGGHRDQQSRRHRRQRAPPKALAPGRRGDDEACDRSVRMRIGGCAARCRVGMTPQQRTAGGDRCHQNVEADRPEAGLAAQWNQRLDHSRIGQERNKAADIAGGIEKIRILGLRMIRTREPGLQQRPIGGEREERQPDRCGEQAKEPERLASRRRAASPDGQR